MSSIFLYLLLGIFNQPVKEKVDIEFKFTSVQYGKPTLAFFYYDVNIQNNTNKPIYIIIPRWFGEKIAATGKIWGANIDLFQKVEGNTLYSLDDNNKFTIFVLKAKEKIFIKDFVIETFDEGMEAKLSTGHSIIFAENITVGDYSLSEFMQKNDEHDKYLEYKIVDGETKQLSVQTKR